MSEQLGLLDDPSSPDPFSHASGEKGSHRLEVPPPAHGCVYAPCVGEGFRVRGGG